MFGRPLDVDSATAYVGVACTGYTALQYRPARAFDTGNPLSIRTLPQHSTQSRTDSLIDPSLPAPRLPLEKRGDTITAIREHEGEPMHPYKELRSSFICDVLCRAGVASHQNGQLEKAVFQTCELKPLNSK